MHIKVVLDDSQALVACLEVDNGIIKKKHQSSQSTPTLSFPLGCNYIMVLFSLHHPKLLEQKATDWSSSRKFFPKYMDKPIKQFYKSLSSMNGFSVTSFEVMRNNYIHSEKAVFQDKHGVEGKTLKKQYYSKL